MSDTTVAGAPAPALEAAEAGPSRATLLVYFGALIAMFMATMDMQIVVTALPTIAGELGNLHLFGWVGAAYLLSTAAVAPFYGKLATCMAARPSSWSPSCCSSSALPPVASPGRWNR